MAGFTDAYELTVLNAVFGGSGTVTNSATWIAYSASTGTECADATYARQQIVFAPASAGATTSSGAVTFPAQTASGNVVECALFTASAAGTQITDWKALTGGTVTLEPGQQFRVPSGDYDLTLD